MPSSLSAASVKVLIVHDHPDSAMPIRMIIHKRTGIPVSNILMAPTLNRAREMFKSNADIIYMVVDGKMPNDTDDREHIDKTLAFIREIQSTSHGVVLCAYSAFHNDEMIQAGCHYACKIGEIGIVVVPKILEILEGMGIKPGPTGN